jgi:hypothetical protein
MPEAVQQSVERYHAQRQYKEMRRALIHSRIRQNVLGQLYIAPLPEWAFAPWENPDEVMEQEAPDLRNASPIKALDGRLLLERYDEPGLVDLVTVDA